MQIDADGQTETLNVFIFSQEIYTLVWIERHCTHTASQDRTNGGTHPNVACENKQTDSKSFKNRNAECTQCSVKGYM